MRRRGGGQEELAGALARQAQIISLLFSRSASLIRGGSLRLEIGGILLGNSAGSCADIDYSTNNPGRIPRPRRGCLV